MKAQHKTHHPKGVGSTSALVLRPLTPGAPVMHALEQETQVRAAHVRPAAVDYVYWLLTTAVWLAWAKAKARRKEMSQIQRRLEETVPDFPGRREQDLLVQLILAALVELGVLPNKYGPYYRQHQALLTKNKGVSHQNHCGQIRQHPGHATAAAGVAWSITAIHFPATKTTTTGFPHRPKPETKKSVNKRI